MALRIFQSDGNSNASSIAAFISGLAFFRFVIVTPLNPASFAILVWVTGSSFCRNTFMALRIFWSDGNEMLKDSTPENTPDFTNAAYIIRDMAGADPINQRGMPLLPVTANQWRTDSISGDVFAGPRVIISVPAIAAITPRAIMLR